MSSSLDEEEMSDEWMSEIDKQFEYETERKNDIAVIKTYIPVSEPDSVSANREYNPRVMRLPEIRCDFFRRGR